MKKCTALLGALVALLVSVAAASADTVEVMKDGGVRLVPFDAPQQFEISHEQWEGLQKVGAVVPIVSYTEAVGRDGLFYLKKQTTVTIGFKHDAIKGIRFVYDEKMAPEKHFTPCLIFLLAGVWAGIAAFWSVWKRKKTSTIAGTALAATIAAFGALVTTVVTVGATHATTATLVVGITTSVAILVAAFVAYQFGRIPGEFSILHYELANAAAFVANRLRKPSLALLAVYELAMVVSLVAFLRM